MLCLGEESRSRARGRRRRARGGGWARVSEEFDPKNLGLWIRVSKRKKKKIEYIWCVRFKDVHIV